MAARLEGRGWTRAVARTNSGKTDAGQTADDFAAACSALSAASGRMGMGVIVSGEYGCGKTSLVKAWCGPVRFYDMNVREHRGFLDPNAYPETYPTLFGTTVVIDDLGAELRSHYGESDYSEARDFICEFHARKSAGARLYITTNLRMRELLDRYGGRLVDRLKDLCIPLRLWGRSKRTWNLE